MTRHFWAILLLLLCCCFAPLRAEEVKVTMKNGSTITGELKELIATVKGKTFFMEKELDMMLDLFLENLPNLWNKCLKRCA